MNNYLKKKLRNKLSSQLLKLSSIRRLYYPKPNLYKKVMIDTSEYYSLMCKMSKEFNTDKSPYNQNGFRHAYTGIYNFLFKKIKNEKLLICELGVLKNESIKLLRNYFKNSTIYAFDNEKDLINRAKEDNLQKVYYNYINIKDEDNLTNTFLNLHLKFDIIIDDSTHVFDDQIKIIKNLQSFLKPGGTPIIEDIFKDYHEENYYKSLKEYNKNFEDIYFIEAKHKNVFTPLWNNNKILVLEKKSE